MITGNLDHLDRLAGQLTGPVKKALELLAERDVTELPVGKKLLAGEDIFASVNEYETEPARDRRPEKHFQYIDIQILGAGREAIGYTDVENAGEITEDRRVLKDAGSAAIYGTRGANGVILVTTKRGSGEAGKTGFRHFLPLGSPSAQLPI